MHSSKLRLVMMTQLVHVSNITDNKCHLSHRFTWMLLFSKENVTVLFANTRKKDIILSDILYQKKTVYSLVFSENR